MAAPADVIAEMRVLGIDSDVVDDHDEIPEKNGVVGHVNARDEIAKHNQTIVEISKMADKMSSLVQEIRNTSKETDGRLREVETDLRILGLEE
jgi:hypothetical protein